MPRRTRTNDAQTPYSVLLTRLTLPIACASDPFVLFPINFLQPGAVWIHQPHFAAAPAPHQWAEVEEMDGLDLWLVSCATRLARYTLHT